MKLTALVSLTVIAGLALWVALTAVDRQFTDLQLIIETQLLGRDPDVAVTAAIDAWERWRFVDALVLIPLLVLNFGGLPVAVFALVQDRTLRAPAGEGRMVFAYYPCFMLQLISTFLSATWVVLMVPFVGEMDTRSFFFFAYFGTQLAASMPAIPAWRRAFDEVAAARLVARPR
jgi:hypothetical protein